MKTIQTVVFNFGYAENWNYTSLIFSTHINENVCYTDAKLALTDLAEDLYSLYLSDIHLNKKYKENNPESKFEVEPSADGFYFFLLGLLKGTVDLLGNIECLEISENVFVELRWTPYELKDAIYDIKNGNYILIEEMAENIFAALLHEKHSEIFKEPAEFLCQDINRLVKTWNL